MASSDKRKARMMSAYFVKMNRRMKLPKLYLTTHYGPDMDALSSEFVWLVAHQLWLTNSGVDIRQRFVPAGERFTAPLREGDDIGHYDTGGILEKKTNDFDHHLDGDPERAKLYPSATSAVYEAYEEKLKPFPWLRELRDVLNEVDTAHREKTEDPHTREVRLAIQNDMRELNALHGTNFRVSSVRLELEAMVRIFQSIPTRGDQENTLSDHAKMWLGLNMLMAWHMRLLDYPYYQKLLDDGKKTEKNGLRFAEPAAGNIDQGILRYVARGRRNRDRLDVLLLDLQRYNEHVLGVCLVDQARVLNLDMLKAEIERRVAHDVRKPRKIYMPREEFALYVSYHGPLHPGHMPFAEFAKLAMGTLMSASLITPPKETL